MTILYQFPQSHYCEKARWALDYKQIPHTCQTVLPGLHFLKTRWMGLASTFPIVRHNGRLIQDSSTIITYLDDQYPDRPQLTPADPTLKHEALEWEAYLDTAIGPHLRRVFYHYILEDRALTAYFFSYNGPFYGRFLVGRMYPILSRLMRKWMSINAAETAASCQKMQVEIDKLRDHYQNRPYLVGDRFTRADLTAASLLAPLHKLPQYGMVWPELPAELETLIASWASQTQWLLPLYQAHR